MLPPGKEGETVRVTCDVSQDLSVRVRMIREPQGHLLLDLDHECFAIHGIAT